MDADDDYGYSDTILTHLLTLHGALCRCEYKETFLADKHEIEGEISAFIVCHSSPKSKIVCSFTRKCWRLVSSFLNQPNQPNNEHERETKFNIFLLLSYSRIINSSECSYQLQPFFSCVHEKSTCLRAKRKGVHRWWPPLSSYSCFTTKISNRELHNNADICTILTFTHS